MIHCFNLILQYRQLPFELRIIDSKDAHFHIGADFSKPNIQMAKDAVIFKGDPGVLETQHYSLIVVSSTIDIDFEISVHCSHEEDWHPIKLGVVGYEPQIDCKFDPPDNITRGTIRLPVLGREGI